MKKKMMKNIGVLVALIATNMVVLPDSAAAQEGFQLGIEGTPQMSWLGNKDDMDNSRFEYLPTYNCSFGLSLQYGFNQRFGIGLNGLYSFQGQRYKFDNVEQIRKTEYLKIPLQLIYFNEMGTDWMFIGKVGPQVGLLMNAKLADKDGNDVISDHKDAYEDIDIGAVLSLGFGYKITEMLSIDAAVRGDCGFTNAENENYGKNINHPNGAITTNRAITNNATVGLTVGLRYLFK